MLKKLFVLLVIGLLGSLASAGTKVVCAHASVANGYSIYGTANDSTSNASAIDKATEEINRIIKAEVGAGVSAPSVSISDGMDPGGISAKRATVCVTLSGSTFAQKNYAPQPVILK